MLISWFVIILALLGVASLFACCYLVSICVSQMQINSLILTYLLTYLVITYLLTYLPPPPSTTIITTSIQAELDVSRVHTRVGSGMDVSRCFPYSTGLVQLCGAVYVILDDRECCAKCDHKVYVW